MLNLSNIDVSKEYRSPEDEIKSTKSYIYQLVEELDYRLGQIYSEGGGMGGSTGLPSGGEDEQPLVGVTNQNAKWSNINYLSDLEYLALALELAYQYSDEDTWEAGEFCIYNGNVYELKIPIEVPEPFDSSKWLYLGNAADISGRTGHKTIEIIIDSVLSSTSTNAVQNRVITNALNNKEDLTSAITNSELEELFNLSDSINIEEEEE